MGDATQSNDAGPTPVGVLTGFLGSGKTTLLNALLVHPGMAQTAVLINEFGEIGIDHLLVEALDEDVMLLNAGCLCCTIRTDLVESLVSLFERRQTGRVPWFRRIMIETTGLADPAPILHTLLGHEALEDRYCVDGIVTTVDAVNADRQLDTHPEPLRQIAVADRLIITKSDLSTPAAVAALHQRLAAINPGATRIEVVDGAVEPSQVLDVGLFDPTSKTPDVERWLNEAAYADPHQHAHDLNRHDDRIRAFSLTAAEPVQMHRFVAWVEALIEAHGDRLLRLKGVLDAVGSETPIVVHGVQHVFHPLAHLSAWPDGERGSRIVVIGHDLPSAAVIESFNRMVCEPRAAAGTQ